MSTVELRGDILYYSAASYSEEEAIGSLNPERWHTFRQTLESLQAAQWQPHYINENALDGHQWKVKIAYADGPLIEASGGNAYPGVLDLRLHSRRRAIAGLAALQLCGDLVDGRPLESRRTGAVGRGSSTYGRT